MNVTDSSEYYVYCYIDPRNFREFYFGKGKGNRSHAHLLDQAPSEKSTLIQQIRAAALEPLVRIIATGLTEEQAFLIESALIWKSGDRLTNANAGNFAKHFRPRDTLYKKLVGFDFSHRLHFFNVGEFEHRSWVDCRKWGYLSAGYGEKYARQVRSIHEGDVVAAYLSKHGYVGIGRVTAAAVPARAFRVGKRLLSEMKAKLKAPQILHDAGDDEECEWVIAVRWIVAVPREEAIWKSGMFSTPQVRVSLAGQSKTVQALENHWGVKLDSILDEPA